MGYRVVFSPEAEGQLVELYRYISQAASAAVAARYASAIVDYCESLDTFPHRGARRDDVRLGLRITNYRKRAVIAFEVAAEVVYVIGIFYGGRDYEGILQDGQDTGNTGH